MALNSNPVAPHRSARWRLARLLLTSLLLGACATRPGHPGAAPRGDLRLDSETVARMRYAGLVRGTGTAVSSTTLAVGATLALATPVVLAVYHHNRDKVLELQESLAECARMAEHRVNSDHFGDRPPTREECGEELEVDGCAEPITRAMLLGRQKHDLALACARDVLTRLWPAPFSIEQRYRYYRASKIVATISREKEQQLIEQRCTEDLWGSIKPDIVLHSDYNLLQAAIIIDLKFPCPPSKPPTWRRYGPKSAYPNSTQGEVYKKALGGEVVLLTPDGYY
ncbi:MAG TPA: hypothetical protein VFZ09_13820 [Archangium sp.]|uniref:hypothetical protein n=1 Tax=Archangium sp. TaxID=1872627 RepID=UPI002E364038|nr:hypothetical protein [Archangium sp.]HEX5747316.1 hypothetical protein [Archangium sp.]